MNPAPLILFVFVLKEIEVRPAGVLGVEVLAGRDTRNRDARRACGRVYFLHTLLFLR